MSETKTAVAGEQNEQNQEEQKGFEAVTSQEDLDRIIQERVARERKKFDGFNDYKAKAVKYDELEEKNKTEADKAAERLAAAEKRATELEAKAARAEVAAAKGVPAALLTGSTQEELEAAADALIAFKGDPQPQKLLIPNEGKSPTTQTSNEAEFVKSLFSPGD